MSDSTFTSQRGNKIYFSHDFEYSGKVQHDSISSALPEITRGNQSFITTHSVAGSPGPLMHAGATPDWIFLVLMTGLMLLTINRFYYQKRLGLLMSAVFSRNSANMLIRESSIFHFQSSFYLIIIYLISMTLLLLQAFSHFEGNISGSWQEMLIYLEITGAFIAYFILKITVIRLGGSIFRNPDTASEYIQNMFIFNLFSGILLLPLLFLITYSNSDIFIYVALGLLAILMVLRFIRGFIIGLSDHKFSLFHLFLYLCTLEILPVLVIAKFVDKYFFH